MEVGRKEMPGEGRKERRKAFMGKIAAAVGLSGWPAGRTAAAGQQEEMLMLMPKRKPILVISASGLMDS